MSLQCAKLKMSGADLVEIVFIGNIVIGSDVSRVTPFYHNFNRNLCTSLEQLYRRTLSTQYRNGFTCLIRDAMAGTFQVRSCSLFLATPPAGVILIMTTLDSMAVLLLHT